MEVVRHCCQEPFELVILFLSDILFYNIKIADKGISRHWYRICIHFRTMNYFQEINIFSHQFVEPFGLADKVVIERACFQKLKNRAVAAADLDNIIRDRRRHAFDESSFCKALFILDYRYTVGRIIDFYNSFRINTVNGSVEALTNDLTAVNGEFTETLFDLEKLRKSCHIKYFKHFRRNIKYPYFFSSLFSDFHQNSQTCTRNVFKLSCVKYILSSCI